MINRILIRVKVVQTLYSHLLVEKDFALEPQPSSPTKEKRFAYALYLDLLMLMGQLASEISIRGRDTPLEETRFVRSVMADDRMRSLKMKYSAQPFPLKPALPALVEKIKESALLKNFLKHSDETANSDIDIWRDLFNVYIIKDATLQAVISRRENYTLRGIDRAAELMNATFVNFYSSNGNLSAAVRTLETSLNASRELYFRLLMLPSDLVRLRDQQLDEQRHKYITTEEDRNPNLRFVENRLVEALDQDPEINAYRSASKLSWIEQDRVTLTALMREILASDIYNEYMELPASDFHTDAEFWRNIFKKVIFRSENFLLDMEDKSVFWNDDMEIIGTFFLKTLKRFDDLYDISTGHVSQEPVLPKFKDDEDARFGSELLSYVLNNKELYRSYIDRYIDTSQWDTERLALMDVVIMMTAIAEIINFQKIPTSVSVNEYIEIAKSYSSPRNASFIHGVLGRVIADLRASGELMKE